MDLAASDSRPAACLMRACVFSFLSLTLASSLPAQLPLPTPTPTTEEQSFLDGARDALSGRIYLSGRVVDKSGALLKDVTIHVKKTYFDPTGVDFRREVESTLESVDGMFSVSCAICRGLYLRVSKEGFYDETAGATASGKAGQRDTHRADLVVTLEKRGQPGRLTLSEGMLRLVGPYEVQALVLRQPGQPPTVERITFQNGLAHRLNWNTGAVDPSPTSQPFLFLAPTAGLGTAPERRSSQMPDGTLSTKSFEPVALRLFASSVTDGFVAAQPVRFQNARLGLRQLREAPPDGYQQSLELRSDQAYTFFYCRIQGLYGKGYSAKPQFSASQEAKDTFSYVTVWLTQDGTRNTEGP